MARLGLGLRRRPPAASYDADAAACFAAMSSPPAPGRKALLSALVAGLKADGVWARLDWLSILAAHDAQAARLNLRHPAQRFFTVGAPVFAVDRGYRGATGPSGYLNSGWDPVNDATHFLQDNAHVSAWVLGNSATTEGAVGNARTLIVPRDAGGNLAVRANSVSGTGLSVPGVATAQGLTAWDRSGGTAGAIYRDGASLAAFSTASFAPNALDFYGCAHNSSGPTDIQVSRQLAACSWGGHLSSAEHHALHARLHAYLAAIGAA